jgi:hypothetical protein
MSIVMLVHPAWAAARLQVECRFQIVQRFITEHKLRKVRCCKDDGADCGQRIGAFLDGFTDGVRDLAIDFMNRRPEACMWSLSAIRTYSNEKDRLAAVRPKVRLVTWSS